MSHHPSRRLIATTTTRARSRPSTRTTPSHRSTRPDSCGGGFNRVRHRFPRGTEQLKRAHRAPPPDDTLESNRGAFGGATASVNRALRVRRVLVAVIHQQPSAACGRSLAPSDLRRSGERARWVDRSARIHGDRRGRRRIYSRGCCSSHASRAERRSPVGSPSSGRGRCLHDFG
jgi:hypothetical protein